MSSVIERFKPSASRRTMLFAAGLTWTVMGATLLAIAFLWLVYGNGPLGIGLAASFAALGLLKSRLVLDRVAVRIAERINERGDARCLGGFLSPRNWLLVGLMMCLGMAVRRLGLPHPVVGSLYAAVGSSLLVSGRVIWRAWASAPVPSR